MFSQAAPRAASHLARRAAISATTQSLITPPAAVRNIVTQHISYLTRTLPYTLRQQHLHTSHTIPTNSSTLRIIAVTPSRKISFRAQTSRPTAPCHYTTLNLNMATNPDIRLTKFQRAMKHYKAFHPSPSSKISTFKQQPRFTRPFGRRSMTTDASKATVEQQQQAISAAPPVAETAAVTTPSPLATEAAAAIPVKTKKPFWKTLLKVIGITLCVLTGGALYMVYSHPIRLALIRASTKLRVHFDDLDYIYRLATPENLNQSIKFIESGDLTTDFVLAQQVWYHDAFVLSHYLDQCMKLNLQIQQQFYSLATQIQARYDSLTKGTADFNSLPQDVQTKVMKLQQLYADLEDITNHSMITTQDLQMFEFMIESANNSFAASPFKPTLSINREECELKYKEISEGVQAAQLYLSQLLELLGIASQNLARVHRYQPFITDPTGYDEYREQCQREDKLKQQQYDEQMDAMQKQLIALKYPHDPEAQQRALDEMILKNNLTNELIDKYTSTPIPIPENVKK